MVNSDRLDLVVPQEPCYPGVVGTLSPLVMEHSPADSVLLPVAYLAAGHLGERDAFGSPPARVNLVIGGDRHTQLSSQRPPRPDEASTGGCGAASHHRSNQVRHARYITLTSHTTRAR
jgi:hypothetical protein